jgi:hypothetical protein
MNCRLHRDKDRTRSNILVYKEGYGGRETEGVMMDERSVDAKATCN